MKILIEKLIFILTLSLLPVLAHAHSAHFAVHSWTDGFFHPLMGWDHLLTMLGVGVWAAQIGGRALRLMPFTFVSIMCLGGMVGIQDVSIASAEALILLSGLVFSVLIVGKVQFCTKINVLIVAFFAFFHGYAHGQEASTSVNFLAYSLGFATATLCLHILGIAFMQLLTKRRSQVA